MRVSRGWVVLLMLFCCAALRAEKVADLPVPTRYVNDFAGMLSPTAQQQLEDLCAEVHNQANADIEVVTIKALEDQSLEEFTAALEEKWKIGKKGVDRSALVVMVFNPRKLRVETGYGLEGFLPDAKVGRILDTAIPFAKTGDYDQAMMKTVQGLADAIAEDAHVTLTPIVHSYHRQQEAVPQGLSAGQIVLGVGVIVLLLILLKTGHIGWLFYILLNMMGGGGGWGGGGGGRGGDDGGGFGGVGGGESGGGGASRDF